MEASYFRESGYNIQNDNKNESSKQNRGTKRKDSSAPPEKKLKRVRQDKPLSILDGVLPNEIYSLIFRQLESEDLYKASLCNKNFSWLINCDKRFFLSRYLERSKDLPIDRHLYFTAAMELGPSVKDFGLVSNIGFKRKLKSPLKTAPKNLYKSIHLQDTLAQQCC